MGLGDVAEDLAEQVHSTKTALFREWILDGGVVARDGVLDLIAGLAGAGIRIAVATTGRRSWVEPLVDGLLAGIGGRGHRRRRHPAQAGPGGLPPCPARDGAAG
jgi:phosphoglycolate phosphatase-like HAD superfamily hydrolase